MRFVRAAALAATSIAMLAASSAYAADPVIKSYFEIKKPRMIAIPGDISTDTNGASPPVFNQGSVVLGFEGISQYDGASFGRNFIPPDTMGAVGMTQYMATTNGAYAVFDKHTGARLSLMSDNQFWQTKAGQTGTSGDTRIMYNADAKRWVMVAFGSNVKDLNVAVSDTDNALGTWKSVKFEGFNGGFSAPVADYPTLALDKNAVYIGTNNFGTDSSGQRFRGTTLNVIPINDLFNAVAPSVANMKQIVTPFNGSTQIEDRGFAIQGVNSTNAGSTGKAAAASLFFFDSMTYDVNGLNPNSAAGATLGAIEYIGEAGFLSPGPARQPSVAIPANRRVIDALDERLSSSVYEVNGRIYMLHSVNSLLDAQDESRVRVVVLDSATNAKLDEFDIGSAGYDYYQGSIAVNALGQVVIGYNRSGLDPATGKIGFYARAFKTLADGSLIETMGETLLKESLTDDYHNGSLFGAPAAGRQRWGDYSQVSVDPGSTHGFYLVGQFAREYNLPQFGHPGGTGGSRWGTWIAGINAGAVPEPASWAMMILGFAFVGAASRRARVSKVGFA